MKQLFSAILIGLLACGSAFGLATQKTNSVNLVLANVCDGTFNDFKFQISGYDDQVFSFNYDKALTGIACQFRLTKPIDGTIYLDVPVTSITVSGTNATFSISRTNIPPPGSYYGELLSYEATTTNFYRSIAQGKLPITWSLYLNESNFFARATNTAGVGQVYVHPNWIDPPWLGTNAGLGSIYATLVMHTGLTNWTDVINTKATNNLASITVLQGFTNAAQTAYGWGNHATNGYITNTTETLWPAVSNTVTVNAANGATAYGWGDHSLAGYLSSATNIFTSLYAADRSKLGANLAGLTAATYTGVVTSVSFTGVTAMTIGKTYEMGFTKANAFGTSTLSIASFSLSKTAAGATSNHYTYKSTDTDTSLILRLDGDGSSKSDVTAVYVKQITNGDINAAGNLNVGGTMVVNGAVMTNPAAHIAETTTAHGGVATNLIYITSNAYVAADTALRSELTNTIAVVSNAFVVADTVVRSELTNTIAVTSNAFVSADATLRSELTNTITVTSNAFVAADTVVRSELTNTITVTSNAFVAADTVVRSELTNTIAVTSNAFVSADTVLRSELTNTIAKTSNAFVVADGGYIPYTGAASNVDLGARNITTTGTNTAGALHVVNGSVLFDGTNGTTPASGAGARLMWIPSKSAIRAGDPDSTCWDDAFIGLYSAAFGYDGMAKGDYSFCQAPDGTAWGSQSAMFSGGGYALSSRDVSFADGKAVGSDSLANGSSVASGGGSTALGSATTGKGIFTGTILSSNTIAVDGNQTNDFLNTEAVHIWRHRLGFQTGNLLIGDPVYVSSNDTTLVTVRDILEATSGACSLFLSADYGLNALAVGTAKAIGQNSLSIGDYTVAKGYAQTVFGKYNVLGGTPLSTNCTSNCWAFIIGNGNDDTNRSNALTLDWSGNMVLAGTITASNVVFTNDTTYLSILRSMTNFTAVASSSNYLDYDPVTRLLSGCVTNQGGGAGNITNIISSDGSVVITAPGGPQPDLSVTNAVAGWSGYPATQNVNMVGNSISNTLEIDFSGDEISIGRAAYSQTDGVAIGSEANAYSAGVALGYHANASLSGVVAGYLASGTNYGVAAGMQASANYYGVGIGREANGSVFGVALGYLANGSTYGTALGFNSIAGSNSVAIGIGVSNSEPNSTMVKGNLNMAGAYVTNAPNLVYTNNPTFVATNNSTYTAAVAQAAAALPASFTNTGIMTAVQVTGLSGNGVVPVGAVQMYVATNPPAGWLKCDGSSIATNTYSALYVVIGATYGSTNVAWFNLPNFNERFPLGATNGLGVASGVSSVTLSSNQIPAHTHGQRGGFIGFGGAGTTYYVNDGTTYNTTEAGGGLAHTNMPPNLTINYIIKY